MATEITLENYKGVNIEKLAMNSKFGSLVFENANKKLKKIQQWLKEVDDLGYENHLPQEVVNQITSYKNQFIEDLQWLQKFDISSRTNPKQEHDDFENRVDSRFNSIYELVARHIPYLRGQVALENRDERKIQEELQAASKARIQAETVLKELEDKLASLKEEKQKVESGHVELAAVRLARHFNDEVKRYDNLSKDWLKLRSKFYWGIIFLLVGFFIFNTFKGWDKLSLQAGIAKIVLLSAVWYGLSFVTRNYNVNSHLAAVNRHRAAVASTLEDFMASNPERQADMLKNATEAMFKNSAVGFVTKSEKEMGNPVFEIVNKIFSGKDG